MDSNATRTTVPFPRITRRGALLGLGGLLATGLPGCGGGGGGGGPAPTAALLMAFFAASTGGARAVMSNRVGDDITLWTVQGRPRQALYEVRGRKVRIYYDGNGAIVRIVDEATGEFVTVTVVDADRTDYNWYGAAGAWNNGFAVLRSGGSYSVAPIVSGVALQGSQLSGSLTGPITASFTLLATGTSGLGVAQPLSGAGTPLFALASRIPGSYAPHRRLAAMLLGTAHADPGPAFPNHLLAAFLMVAGALTLGVDVSPMVSLAAIAVMAYAVYVTYIQLRRPGVLVLGNVYNRLLGDGLQEFEEGGDPAANVRTNIAAYLASPTTALLQLALIATVHARLQAITHAFQSNVLARNPSALQPITGGPPSGTTALSGPMVDTSGFTWQVNATYNPSSKALSFDTGTSGPTRITGSGSGGSGTYTATTGGTTETGTYTVQERALGACQSQQSSGGQGTFSNTHDMGQDSGTFELDYQMYSIPDRLDVRDSKGQLLYSTGGLVSGGQTVSVPFSGGRIVHVLISAPTSGTVWDYRIGCPA